MLWTIEPFRYGAADRVQSRLGYNFARPAFLYEALTHRSAYVGVDRQSSDALKLRPWNERLEFLGDSVLGLVISESLIANEGSLSEGEMSRIRAAIVCEANLALKAREFLCLSEALVLGPSELASGGLEKVSLLADALESVIGAVFADGGWEAARAVVRRLFFGELAGDPRRYLLGDAKTMLQELAQQRFKVTPTYVVVAESGPPHQRWFEVSAQLGDQEIARGSGQSKKEAAQAAARLALDRMKEMTL